MVENSFGFLEKVIIKMDIGDYLTLIALFLSMISIWISLKTSKRAKIRGEYDKKIKIYEAIKKYFDKECHFDKSIHLAMGDPDVHFNKMEYSGENLELDIEKIYGKEIWKLYKETMSLCSQANSVDSALGQLFEHQTGNSLEKKEKLGSALRDVYEGTPFETGFEKNKAYLESLHIEYTDSLTNEEIVYDYKELTVQRQKLEKEVQEAKINLENKMKKAIKYN